MAHRVDCSRPDEKNSSGHRQALIHEIALVSRYHSAAGAGARYNYKSQDNTRGGTQSQAPLQMRPSDAAPLSAAAGGQTLAQSSRGRVRTPRETPKVRYTSPRTQGRGKAKGPATHRPSRLHVYRKAGAPWHKVQGPVHVAEVCVCVCVCVSVCVCVCVRACVCVAPRRPRRRCPPHRRRRLAAA